MHRNREHPSRASTLCLALGVLFVGSSQLLALNASRQLSAYGRQTWRTDSGLPQNTVHAILQSHDGYIWLATEGGLVRFDGINFVTYNSQNTPQLKSDNIRSLLEDGEHNLWIATAAGLSRFNGSEFQAFTTAQGLPSNDVWSIHQDHGRPWITTPEGASEYRSNHFERYQPSPISIPGNTGAALVNASGLPSSQIICVYQDREGIIWVGTDGGLARIRNGKVERFAANDPLSSDVVLSVFEDREGDLWVGTDSGGLTVLRDQKFTAYTTKDGLPGDLVRCIFEDRSGRLWIGTDAGLGRFEAGRVSVMTTKDGLSSNVILSLAEDAEGNLLAGTPDGLNVLRNGRVSVITSADGLPDDFVRSIYKDADGSLWIGTRRGLSHWNAGVFTNYAQRDGLGSDLVGAILRDREGSLWIATFRGLTRFRNGKFVTYSEREGLSSNTITALWQDGEGVLWIGTQDGGLNRLEQGKIFRYPVSAGIPSVIYGILEDARNQFWLTSKTGIFRVSREDLNAMAQGRVDTIAVAAYTAADGLMVSECSDGGHPAACKTHDGALWFATLKGVATTQPLSAEANRPPALPVVIESISVDDQVLSPAQANDVAPGHSRFAFEYAGLSFAAPHSVRFRYKLEGFDRNWIDAGPRRVAYYTNIAPAKYRFRVMARTNDGSWNESGASFSFRLRPHFYQTYWFDFLLLCGSLFVAWQVYRWRVRQVQEKFDAVLVERNRIAREIHDTLAQGFVALSIQLELISHAISNSKDAAQTLLREAQLSVQNNLSEARRSIWELRSQNPDNEDLPSKLSKIATEVNSTNRIKAEFQVFGTRRPLPSKIEEELLKIGQEAVTNVVRHAGAKHVRIDLSFEPKRLILAVSDDGCGFVNQASSSGPNGHFGLKGMRERAQQIHADLSVKSAAGQGTQILVQAEIE